MLFGGFIVTALYFVAASLVFPDDLEAWDDLDAHFDKQRRLVLGGIFLCNVALVVTTLGPTGGFDSDWNSENARILRETANEISAGLGFSASGGK